ncbi:hypothetical protein SAMN05216417_10183 [Nitrosospira multiformis]|uniref:Uncharacterized protein n=1 Tax=Nitrosospira multiformis TaxID=1231 RepID=A0A1I7F369_9PROT|nr:hypothetical protein SAMN05216417_10183 [Nitrosospira multiformis]
MRTPSLVCSAFTFAAMASIAQAEPAVMNQPEPMRLTAPEMNNITAGASVTIATYASGTETSYSDSRAADFLKTPSDGTSITVDCCGAQTTDPSIVVIPREPVIYY